MFSLALDAGTSTFFRELPLPWNPQPRNGCLGIDTRTRSQTRDNQCRGTAAAKSKNRQQSTIACVAQSASRVRFFVHPIFAHLALNSGRIVASEFPTARSLTPQGLGSLDASRVPRPPLWATMDVAHGIFPPTIEPRSIERVLV